MHLAMPRPSHKMWVYVLCECLLWGEGYLVIGGTGSEAVQGGFALGVSHTCQDLLATLGAHLPHCGQVLSLHALHQWYLHVARLVHGHS